MQTNVADFVQLQCWPQPDELCFVGVQLQAVWRHPAYNSNKLSISAWASEPVDELHHRQTTGQLPVRVVAHDAACLMFTAGTAVNTLTYCTAPLVLWTTDEQPVQPFRFPYLSFVCRPLRGVFGNVIRKLRSNAIPLHWFHAFAWTTATPANSVIRDFTVHTDLNSAAWLIAGVRQCDHITSILRDVVRRLPVRQTTQYKIAMMAFTCVSGLWPAYSMDVCVPVSTAALGVSWRFSGALYQSQTEVESGLSKWPGTRPGHHWPVARTDPVIRLAIA